jgi:type 1 glutamine amidotransferase
MGNINQEAETLSCIYSWAEWCSGMAGPISDAWYDGASNQVSYSNLIVGQWRTLRNTSRWLEV